MVEEKEQQILQESPEPLLPAMQMNLAQPEEKPIITNDQMVGMYQEIFECIKEDRQEAHEAYKIFMNMVVNEGDATTSSKEAMVQLLRIKSESADKMTKVLDLLMGCTKSRGTTKYVNAHQENKVVIKTDSKKREIIARMQKKLENKP